ncbi:MAG: hypothetical protein LBS70_05020 [Candidatus Accumulibacter sp.]|jgi:ABC-type phosphate transport system substrate-binding protein|nr:hypothetical protein [Accumulibacter sp.]
MDKTTLPARVRTLVLLACLGLSPPALAELAVIVNPQSGVDQLTRTQVINIFLGNNREFPDGLRAKPFDLPAANPDKEIFYRALVNRNLNQMAAYWSRLVFAGNTPPPVQAEDAREVVQMVAANRNAIGYVDRRFVEPGRVRVVFTLP